MRDESLRHLSNDQVHGTGRGPVQVAIVKNPSVMHCGEIDGLDIRGHKAISKDCGLLHPRCMLFFLTALVLAHGVGGWMAVGAIIEMDNC